VEGLLLMKKRKKFSRTSRKLRLWGSRRRKNEHQKIEGPTSRGTPREGGERKSHNTSRGPFTSSRKAPSSSYNKYAAAKGESREMPFPGREKKGEKGLLPSHWRETKIGRPEKKGRGDDLRYGKRAINY